MKKYSIKAWAYSTFCTEHQATEPVLVKEIFLTPATLASQVADIVKHVVLETKAAVLREMVYNSDAGSRMRVTIQIDNNNLNCLTSFPDMDKNISFAQWETSIAKIGSNLTSTLSLKLYQYILSSDKFKSINISDADN